LNKNEKIPDSCPVRKDGYYFFRIGGTVKGLRKKGCEFSTRHEVSWRSDFIFKENSFAS
jgi:hypothetical protein